MSLKVGIPPRKMGRVFRKWDGFGMGLRSVDLAWPFSGGSREPWLRALSCKTNLWGGRKPVRPMGSNQDRHEHDELFMSFVEFS